MITENAFYGIFSDEADAAIVLVRRHHPLAEIEPLIRPVQQR